MQNLHTEFAGQELINVSFGSRKKLGRIRSSETPIAMNHEIKPKFKDWL